MQPGLVLSLTCRSLYIPFLGNTYFSVGDLFVSCLKVSQGFKPPTNLVLGTVQGPFTCCSWFFGEMGLVCLAIVYMEVPNSAGSLQY